MAFLNKIGNVVGRKSRKLASFESSTSSTLIYQGFRCFSSKLFIGGLSYVTDENSLREAFTPYGNVTEARIIVDRESGRSRGFGFVSYTSSEEASAAIQALDGRDIHGRPIKVAYAAEKQGINQGPHFSGGFSNYGSGGGYNDYNTTGTRNTRNWTTGEYDPDNNVNVGQDSNFDRPDFTNTASDNYGYNANARNG